MQVGRVAGPQGSLEHHIGEPVQLDEDHTWHVGDGRLTGPPPRSVSGALIEPGVVVDGEQGAHQRRHYGKPDGDDDGGPEVVEVHTGQRVEHQEHHEGLEKDGAEAEGQYRDRDDDERQGRPDH